MQTVSDYVDDMIVEMMFLTASSLVPNEVFSSDASSSWSETSAAWSTRYRSQVLRRMTTEVSIQDLSHWMRRR